MAQVNLQINGRDYLIACEDGEEKHLTFLAKYINRQVEGLVESVGQVGEARLLLMASLMVADELAETSQELDALKDGEEGPSDGSGDGDGDGGDMDQATLDKLSQRIEDIAARLENS
ncbi:MAG: cell division protein ZapA [Rhodospirillaceae bacterium]|jgi:cell division protein ZapA|nr:cell division protein ZapA [Rhodospirillaceae bacterium]MBT4486062.1 cell division protein ZapA [Rhodospirillaceae bacterium]MBT5191644.1 cell division protein ZapA [Rhodospirillaceae bacterium]MBT5898526.1 cell division protein ZapA [Rhodospirillaceae bacterium]MBT6429738.1 cell division protein ZapA [Rhodospirillaceae bacterium]